MKTRFILPLLMLTILGTNACSTQTNPLITAVTPPLVNHKVIQTKIHVRGSGFQGSSHPITGSIIGGITAGAMVLADDDIQITIYPDINICGPATIQLGDGTNVYASTELFSYFADTAEFTGPKSVATGNSPITGIAAANFNRQVADASGVLDTLTDLAVAKTADNVILVYPGSLDGSASTSQANFGAPTTVALDKITHFQPGALVSADFDQDGNTDLALIDHDTTGAGQDQVSLLLGKGDGTFQAPSVIFSSATDKFQTLVVEALDTTAIPPISLGLVSVNAANITQFTAFQRQPAGSYAPVGAAIPLLPAGMNFQSIAMGDFNGDPDHHLDLAVAIANSKVLVIFPGLGNGVFSTTTRSLTLSFEPQAVIAADYNSDQRIDLVAFNKDNTFAVLLGHGGEFPIAQQRNNQDTAFDAGSPVAFVGKGNFITKGDFNGDRKPDVIVVNNDASIGFMLSQCPTN